MTRIGRPLHFLALVLGGWAFFRLLLIGEADSFLPTTLAVPRTVAAPVLVAAMPWRSPAATTAAPVPPADEPPTQAGPAPEPLPGGQNVSSQKVLRLGVLAPDIPTAAPLPDAQPAAPARSRWSASAWVVARGNGQGGSPAPQLGGGQAGVRIVRVIDAKRRLAVAARATTPLEGAGRELAAGVEWQPTSLPMRLIAEHRVGIDTRSGGPTLAVVGGVGPVAVGAFALESYVAGGVIGRDGLQGFAEASLRVTRTVKRIGETALAVGAGAWGAAQPGAERVDIGPSVELALPVGGQRVRAILDWRQRVSGDARPGSGPVLTLAADF